MSITEKVAIIGVSITLLTILYKIVRTFTVMESGFNSLDTKTDKTMDRLEEQNSRMNAFDYKLSLLEKEIDILKNEVKIMQIKESRGGGRNED